MMSADSIDVDDWLAAAGHRARAASRALMRIDARAKNVALERAAFHIRSDIAEIIEANQRDLFAFSGVEASRDRLLLDEPRLQRIAASLEELAKLPDPPCRDLGSWSRPNGLKISRIPVPIGVIGIVYESRPGVGVDATALSLKSGNAAILRGGSDSFNSAIRLHQSLLAGLRDAGLPEDVAQMAPVPDRSLVGAMLRVSGLIDLIIPRGGKSLIKRVLDEALIPVLAHAEGLNHTYIDKAANLPMARRLIANAKMRRPSVCGATETLLIDVAVADRYLPPIVKDLTALGCDFRADRRAQEIVPILRGATEDDFRTEWQAAVLSVAVVDGLDEAIDHIARFGSQHTDAIITDDANAARRFLAEVDSAVTLWNASTQFSDGGEFGFGAEIGISTGRLHARGPIGLEQLTTFRYVVEGDGQVRG